MLPRYSSPPVVEVAISVQFDELTRMQPMHFGLFYAIVEESYPTTEHHLPVTPITEFFESSSGVHLSFSARSNLSPGRCWYLSSDKAQLVQIQADRFTFNWRKLDAESSYPSYDELRKRFNFELRRFLMFVQEKQLGEFVPLQCELTYVNHINLRSTTSETTDVSQVFSQLSRVSPSSDLSAPEALSVTSSFVMREADVPIGRLHAQIHTGLRMSDSTPTLVFQLVGRGAPRGQTVEEILEFTDKAHEWVVRGFTELTTRPMHELWGRTV